MEDEELDRVIDDLIDKIDIIKELLACKCDICMGVVQSIQESPRTFTAIVRDLVGI